MIFTPYSRCTTGRLIRSTGMWRPAASCPTQSDERMGEGTGNAPPAALGMSEETDAVVFVVS
jgi:hypothetical protein